MTRTARRPPALGPRFWLLVGLWTAWLGFAYCVVPTAHAEEGDVTALDVDRWVVSYSVQRSSAEYPYTRLVADARRVVACESSNDPAVLNGRVRGKAGEWGAFQFLPGRGSIYYLSAAAAAGWPMQDAEANVAAGVQLIAAGMGPRNWSCW